MEWDTQNRIYRVGYIEWNTYKVENMEKDTHGVEYTYSGIQSRIHRK